MKLFLVAVGSFAIALSSTAHARACQFELNQTFDNQYLNKPGISVYKNAISVSDFYLKCGEFGEGLALFKGLGQRDFLAHELGNEIDFYADWRHRFDWVEMYIRLSYFMNDFVPPRGGIHTARDDQWIIDMEVSYFRLAILQPYIAYRYFGSVGEGSPHAGSFWWLGVRRNQPVDIGIAKTLLNLEMQLAFSDGALGVKGKQGGLIYGRLLASWVFPITDTFFVIPHFIWQIANGSQQGGPRDYALSKHQERWGITFQKKF